MPRNKSSTMAKLKSPNSGVSPLMMKYFSSNSNSNSNSSSPGDPFSPPSKMSISSSSNSNNTPLTAVEEDVLVMDGILMDSSSSPLSSGWNIDGGFNKTELCRSWEDFGNCRFGTKCQFAHGKEELRLSRFPVSKSKSDAQICRSHITGSCIYGSKCRFLYHKAMTDAALVLTSQMPSPIRLPHEHTTRTSITAPVTFKSPGTSSTTTIKPTKTVEPNRTISSKGFWLPQDDGIQVALPCLESPSREEVDAYIAAVLYHQAARRRLPVFTETCPD